jgi:hypothetical protein
MIAAYFDAPECEPKMCISHHDCRAECETETNEKQCAATPCEHQSAVVFHRDTDEPRRPVGRSVHIVGTELRGG